MHNKNKLKKLIKQIEDARIMLDDLISEKQCDLLDTDVIELSQSLDDLLSEYYSLK